MTNNLQFQQKYRQKAQFNPEITPPKYTIGILSEQDSSTKHRTQEKQQQMNITALQAQYKSSLNSYQIKFRNMQQQCKRSKQEMERKIIELTKQKNHLQNLVQSYARENFNDIRQNQLRENNNLCRDGQNRSEFQKLQKNMAQIKNQLKNKDISIDQIQKQKKRFQQNLKKIKEENSILQIERQKLGLENLRANDEIRRLRSELQTIKSMDQKRENKNQISLNILTIPIPEKYSISCSKSKQKQVSQAKSSIYRSKSTHGHHVEHGHHEHRRNSHDVIDKTKHLEIMLDRAHKKIKQLTLLIDELNQSAIASGLQSLNNRIKKTH